MLRDDPITYRHEAELTTEPIADRDELIAAIRTEGYPAAFARMAERHGHHADVVYNSLVEAALVVHDEESPSARW